MCLSGFADLSSTFYLFAQKRMKLSAPRFLLAAVAAAAAALLASTVDALDPLVVLDVAEDVRLEHW